MNQTANGKSADIVGFDALCNALKATGEDPHLQDLEGKLVRDLYDFMSSRPDCHILSMTLLGNLNSELLNAKSATRRGLQIPAPLWQTPTSR